MADEELGSGARQMRAAAPWLGAVWKLLNGTVVGVVGGYLLDRWLGWTPWGLIGGSVVGISVGFYGFLHDALKLGKKPGGPPEQPR